MEADQAASYYETIDINLDEIKEPILCAPNDPDDARAMAGRERHALAACSVGASSLVGRAGR